MKLLIALFFAMIATVGTAKESYPFIIPNTPGSVSDLIARSMANIYNKKTGNTLVIQNVGGGQQVPAAVRFSNLNSPAIIMSTTGILVFNPVLQKSLPYDLSIFDHVGGISFSPIIWVVRSDSPYKSMKDLVEQLPKSKKPLVAYANLVEVVNLHMLSKKYGWSQKTVEEVKYRGVPEVVQGLLAADIDVAVVSSTQALTAQIEAGNLRAIGTTVPTGFILGSLNVPSVQSQIGVEQYTGGNFLSLNKKFNAKEAAQLKNDLYAVLSDPEFLTDLKKYGSIPIQNGNSNTNFNTFLESFINTVRSLNLQQQ